MAGSTACSTKGGIKTSEGVLSEGVLSEGYCVDSWGVFGQYVPVAGGVSHLASWSFHAIYCRHCLLEFQHSSISKESLVA